MLFYLFSADELRRRCSAGCGYRLDPDAIPRTVEYYLARTTHGSTLSGVVHAWVLARGRRHEALRVLRRGAGGGRGRRPGRHHGEGIHLAAMAGTVDLLQRCFGGVETRGDVLHLNPYWPAELGPLEFSLRYREHRLQADHHRHRGPGALPDQRAPPDPGVLPWPHGRLGARSLRRVRSRRRAGRAGGGWSMSGAAFLEVHETHSAVIVLAGEQALKFKKPVDLGFLDFTELEQRRLVCEREVALNRRIAADVYDGVSTVVGQTVSRANTWSRCAACRRSGDSPRWLPAAPRWNRTCARSPAGSRRSTPPPPVIRPSRSRVPVTPSVAGGRTRSSTCARWSG